MKTPDEAHVKAIVVGGKVCMKLLGYKSKIINDILIIFIK